MEKDERFKHISSDPKFRRIPRQERKVKIDKRFQSMFKDAKFKVKSSVDKRGRPESFASSENFRRFYDLSSSADSSSSGESEESEGDEHKVEKKLKTKEQIKTKTKLPNKKQRKTRDSESSSDEEAREATSNLGKTLKVHKESGKSQKVSVNSKPESSKNKKEVKKLKAKKKQEPSDESDEESDEEISSEGEDSVLDAKPEEGTVVSASVREKLRDLSVDYARGGGRLHSEEESSSDEESEDSGQESAEEVEHAWGELDKDADRTEESTSRLAVCNMDWQRVRAEDLMVLLSSFLPPTGAITSVSVYPSDFGLQCLKEEEKHGPKELAEQKPLMEGDDGSEQLNVEHLRSYELRRLRYYYAVVCCDSAATAGHLYSECDGIEYESSAARLDLRFVPDDTTFDHEPREVCTSLPDAGKYQPRYYSSGALTQAKFELTWDETDPRRVELSQRLWASKDKELPEDELRGVLASSSSEDEQDGEGLGARYRALLDGGKGEEKGEEVEVSWGLELQAKADKKAEQGKREAAGLAEPTPFEELMKKKRDKSRQKKMERLKKHEQASGNADGEQAAFSDDDLPAELQDVRAELTAERSDKPKRKGKKKKGRKEQEEQDPQQRAELELLLLDEEGEQSRHFNLGTRQPAKDHAKDDEFEVDVADPRFGALYTSHHFNLDPADPHFKASRSTQALVAEKLRRRTQEHREVSIDKTPKAKRPRDAELSQLVRNVKRKTEMSMASRGKRH